MALSRARLPVVLPPLLLLSLLLERAAAYHSPTSAAPHATSLHFTTQAGALGRRRGLRRLARPIPPPSAPPGPGAALQWLCPRGPASAAAMVATITFLCGVFFVGLNVVRRAMVAGCSGRSYSESRDSLPELVVLKPEPPDPQSVAAVVSALRRGCLVVFTTETVYGLAADPTVEGAVDRICEAKGRDANKPVALMAASVEQVEELGADFGKAGMALAERYWPGPLTLVLQVPDGSFQGFRVPRHPIPLAIAKQFRQPLLLTSANRSGQPDARTAQEALAEVGEYVAVVLDSGPALAGVPSTVVKVEGDQLTLLREGAIPFRKLQALHDAALQRADGRAAPAAPADRRAEGRP